MRIALDLDGVLADLQHTMIEETKYTSDDFEQWSKPDYNFFMQEASRVWREYWQDIPPVEDRVELTTAQLAADHHVDIVTNTAGPDDAITKWLDKHGVYYEEIVRPYSHGCDKPDLDYDAYIDDKPTMAGAVDVLYLRDQRWNQSVRGSGQYLYYSYEDCYVESEGPLKPDPFRSDAPWVIRITDLDDVLFDLEQQVPLDHG